MNLLEKLIGGVAIAVGTVVAAHSQAASLSTWLEPSHIITRYQNTEWADSVREATDGEIDFEVFAGGSLLPTMGTMQGVADGVAQVGVFAADYAPSQLPVSNALADMGFLNPDSMTLAFAYTDFMINEEVGNDEWRRSGVIFGASHATPAYQILCKDEVTSLTELRGKRVRISGSGRARLSEALGLVPVSMPSSEIYMGLDRGALDCVIADVTHLRSGASILEMVGSVIMVDLAPAFNSAGIMYNPDFWKNLSDDQRRLLLDEMAVSMVRLQMAFAQEEVENIAAGKEAGISFVEPDAALQREISDWVADDVGGMSQIAREQYRIEDPEALFALFESYLTKWDGLLQDVDLTDEAALVALLKENLFDDIDAAAYGTE